MEVVSKKEMLELAQWLKAHEVGFEWDDGSIACQIEQAQVEAVNLIGEMIEELLTREES